MNKCITLNRTRLKDCTQALGQLQERSSARGLFAPSTAHLHRGAEPLELLLLTSEGQPGQADALRAVQRYEHRWGIEEFFRALKSGMRIQDRQLRTAESLQRCLAFEAVNALRVFELQRYAREEPQRMEVFEDLVQFRRERPLTEDIRGWVMRPARIAGFRTGSGLRCRATKCCGRRGRSCRSACCATRPGAEARRPVPRSPQPARLPCPPQRDCGPGPNEAVHP